MKYCMKCGAELPDEARFCAECGAQQERRPARRTEPPAERHEEPQAIHREEPQDIRHEEPQAVHREGPQAAPGRSHARQAVEEAVASWKTEVQPQLAKAGRSLPALSLSLPQKLGAFGAVVVVFAAFQPIVTLMNMMVLTIDDLSKSSQAFLALLGALAGVAAWLRRMEFLTLIGTSLLLPFLIALLRYQARIAEMSKHALGRFAASATQLDWGVYLLALGIVLLIVAGVLAKLAEEERAATPGAFFGAWWRTLTSSVTLGATSLPGWVLPVGVLVVFFVLFSTSSPSAALMNHLK